MKKQQTQSSSSWTSTKYETEIRYLQYETSQNRLSVPLRIRERHLTEDTDSVIIQAIGDALRITIPSSRDTIQIEIGLGEWSTSRAFERKVSEKGIIYIESFTEELSNYEEKIPVTVSIVDEEHDGLL